MTNLKNIHDAYLADEEGKVIVNRELKDTLKDQLMPKRKFWTWTIPAFVGALAMLALMLIVNPPRPDVALDSGGGLVGGFEHFELDMANFSCEGDCSEVKIVVNGEQMTGDDCPTCREVNIWANYTDDKKKTVMISSYNFATIRFDVVDHPDWQTVPYEVTTKEGIKISLQLQDVGEWNLMQNAECIESCENLRLGNIYANQDAGEIYQDTCPPKPCDLIEIDHSGFYGDEHSPGGYGLHVHKRNSSFMINEIEELADLAYTEEELNAAKASGGLHFEEDILGRRISFDLVANEDDDAVAYKGDVTSNGDVQLLANGVPLDGIEGSYCKRDHCVDKLITFEGADFVPVEGDTFTFTVDEPLEQLTVGIMNPDGIMLRCVVPVTKVSDTEYAFTACAKGIHVIAVQYWYADGGDAAWYYPVDMMCEKDCSYE